jgi:hypothetical protein
MEASTSLIMYRSNKHHPIDSITWKQKLDSPNKAVTVFVHAHDPQNKTLFYRWDYVETWQYEAPLNATLGLDSQGTDLLYRCNHTNIQLLGNIFFKKYLNGFFRVACTGCDQLCTGGGCCTER